MVIGIEIIIVYKKNIVHRYIKIYILVFIKPIIELSYNIYNRLNYYNIILYTNTAIRKICVRKCENVVVK